MKKKYIKKREQTLRFRQSVTMARLCQKIKYLINKNILIIPRPYRKTSQHINFIITTRQHLELTRPLLMHLIKTLILDIN
jgi:hypothetical protein